jgi:hypothetical protein
MASQLVFFSQTADGLACTHMNVIQLNLHMLSPSCSECRASLMPTDLYIRSERAVVGSMTSLSPGVKVRCQ